ncbi:MAG: sodium:solute symporter family protein [Rhodothermales bacterium]
MALHAIDWVSIIAFFVISLAIGLAVARRAGKNAAEFFLSGRNMPWWLLGVSMVATTFSADTPNLVTHIVRRNGVAGNWVWWTFLLTGMLTVFVYAKLWRRSGVLTDLEFYELRYSGPAAAFLRGFRAVYLGVFFNVVIMASVSLAIIKIAGIMLGVSPVETVIVASVVTVVYSAIGGLRGVLITDFFQFVIAMIGSVGAAIVIVNLPEVGGLSGLLANDVISTKTSLLPDFSDSDAWLSLIILPIAVQWWSVWYPGAEPGGGGYIAQRMLSAKNEDNAVGATLFFNAAHYALRPWPWIIVALCSLVVFPDVASIQRAFPNIDPSVLGDDLGYSAMLTYLPSGLLGLVIASLFAAFMSTISTHLNWGSSYVVNDVYKRFIAPDAPEKKLVMVGRISTVVLMVLAGILALLLSTALQAFNIMLQIGAGTGLLFILRWFWWRINPWSEITAMVVSFIVALFFQFVDTGLSSHLQLVTGVGITSICWIGVTFMTSPSDHSKLTSFIELVNPGGPGWRAVENEAHRRGESIRTQGGKWDVPTGILCMVFGCLTVYGTLFSTGYFLYGNLPAAAGLGAVAIVSAFLLLKAWRRLKSMETA